jgi:hypothetical protein
LPMTQMSANQFRAGPDVGQIMVQYMTYDDFYQAMASTASLTQAILSTTEHGRYFTPTGRDWKSTHYAIASSFSSDEDKRHQQQDQQQTIVAWKQRNDVSQYNSLSQLRLACIEMIPDFLQRIKLVPWGGPTQNNIVKSMMNMMMLIPNDVHSRSLSFSWWYPMDTDSVMFAFDGITTLANYLTVLEWPIHPIYPPNRLMRHYFPFPSNMVLLHPNRTMYETQPDGHVHSKINDSHQKTNHKNNHPLQSDSYGKSMIPLSLPMAIHNTIQWRQLYQPWRVSDSVVNLNYNGWVYTHGWSRCPTTTLTRPSTSSSNDMSCDPHAMVWIRVGHILSSLQRERVHQSFTSNSQCAATNTSTDKDRLTRQWIRVILHTLERAIVSSLDASEGRVGKVNVVIDAVADTSDVGTFDDVDRIERENAMGIQFRQFLETIIYVLRTHYHGHLGTVYVCRYNQAPIPVRKELRHLLRQEYFRESIGRSNFRVLITDQHGPPSVTNGDDDNDDVDLVSSYQLLHAVSQFIDPTTTRLPSWIMTKRCQNDIIDNGDTDGWYFFDAALYYYSLSRGSQHWSLQEEAIADAFLV